MGKKHNSKFPAAKIKRIIQENQDIGKLCNTIPPVIEKSLEIFLDDIVSNLQKIIKEYNLTKLTLPSLKKSVEDSSYNFMKDSLKDIEELEVNEVKRRKRISKDADQGETKKSQKKQKHKEEDDDE